ncbi:MAG: complex I subunit 4 family protein [Candidatus Dormibacteria bacterium]
MTLPLLLLIPLAAALLCARVPENLIRPAALLGAGLCVLLAALAFSAAGDGHPLTFFQAWAPGAGIAFRLEADGVSSSLVLLNAALFLLAILATRMEQVSRPRLFLALLLITEAAVAGVLLARDLVLFYVFWEAVLLPLFLLISVFGEGRRQYSALKLLIFTGLGSLAMLLSILALALAHAPSGGPTFDLDQLAAVHLSTRPVLLGLGVADFVFLGFAVAFAVKAPLFPFHGWLADAYASSPTPVVMVLAGIVSKLGPYGFYRIAVSMLPNEASRFSPLLMALAAVGIVYGALLALRQRDAKRMVAYLSLSHMCFITLGIVGLTTPGLQGGVLQMVNHGILIASMFFIVGHIERGTGTRDRSVLAGLARRAPGLSALFLILALATLGLPGLNGFVGEYLIMLGTYARSWSMLLLAAVGVVLASWYTLRLYQGLMNGPAAEGPGMDLAPRDAGVLVPLAAFAIVIGVYPGPLLAVIGSSVAGVSLLFNGPTP